MSDLWGLTYQEPTEGRWVQPIKKGYRMACCDCGLVHRMDFRVKDGRAQFRVFRDNRSTRKMRDRFESIRIIKETSKRFEDLMTRLADGPEGESSHG